MANTYFDMLKAVENYYGAGSDQWVTMANWSGHSSVEVANILKQVPGVNTTVNEAGELLTYSLESSGSVMTAAEATAATAANAINSNAVTAEAVREAVTIPANVAAGATTGTVEIASGATKVATGSTAMTALAHVGTWVVGAGVGMKLGVWIDGALYNANPDFWDSHNMEYLNPERWTESKITGWLYDYSGYDDFIAMFNADDQQFYIDENLFALIAQYLANEHFFDDGVPKVEKGDLSDDLFYYPEYVNDPVPYYINTIEFYRANQGYNPNHIKCTAINNTEPVYFVLNSNNINGYNSYGITAYSKAPFDLSGTQINTWGTVTTRAGDIVYIKRQTYNWSDSYFDPLMQFLYTGGYTGIDDHYFSNDIPVLLYHGTEVPTTVPEGVNQYDTTPTGITDQMTPQQIVDLLKQQFPEIWDEKLKQGTLNDDGTITERIYVPIAMPTGGTEGQPTTDPDHPGAIDPDNEMQTQTATKMIQRTPDPAPIDDYPDTGTGNTPTLVTPTGSADALYKIYNPTNAQIQSFGAWLWSSNFVDQLLKVFSDPMQAIISLHKIYATPHIGGQSNIKVGYLDSGVSSNWVDEQYIEVDCGSVNVLEVRGNVLDYDPYVDIKLYLPFIGIVTLSTADVMRGKVGVKYKIDVITGTLVAFVSVSRDSGAGGVIYQYTGSMCEAYPLSSGSYMGILTGVLGIAAGVAGTIATGGAAAPALLGAAAGLSTMHTKVEHSNGFSGNAGAMACKKPYLIISRQQSAISNGVAAQGGYPGNTIVRLSQCSGFTKIKYVHLQSIRKATDFEHDDIIRKLKEGVII